MLYFLKITNLHYSRSNVTVRRTRVNQNRNILLNNLTYYFNHSWLVIFLAVLQCCINSRDCPCYLTHCFCFLNVISWPCTFILKWTISAQVGSFTFPTFKWTFILMWLFRLSTCHSNWITRSLEWPLLLIPESRRFETFPSLVKLLILLVLPCPMVIRFTFDLLIAILSLPYGFFCWFLNLEVLKPFLLWSKFSFFLSFHALW